MREKIDADETILDFWTHLKRRETRMLTLLAVCSLQPELRQVH